MSLLQSERRLLANALTHQLRRGWETYAEHRQIGNPQLPTSSGGYSSGGGFAKHIEQAAYETIRYQFVRGFLSRDERLGTRDIAYHLLRADHDKTVSNLKADYQAEYLDFLEESRAAPFHARGVDLRRDTRRCSKRAAVTLLRLVLACSVEIIDPLDAADEFAEEEERVDLEELQRAAGIRALAVA